MSSKSKLHDRQAEQALLGSMMTDPAVVPAVVALLGHTPDAFFTTDHQLIYSAILACADRNNATDSILVATELSRSDNLNRIGGGVYLYDLQEKIVETENSEFYAEIVREKFIRRRLLRASREIDLMAREEETPLEEVLNSAQEEVFSLHSSTAERGFVRIDSVLPETIDRISRETRSDGVIGVPTGFASFDQLTSGLHSGDFIIIAARPGMGKTTLMLNMAQNIAIELAVPIAIFSLEMPASQLCMRMLSAEAQVDFRDLRSGDISEDSWQQIQEASDRLMAAPIFINDARGLKIQSVRAEARRLKAKHEGLAVVVVDYLQLLSGSNRYSGREQEISEISRSLKHLAGELKLTVIACSQLSREVERRPNKRPLLSDLRESGAIEQDADLVGFIYREDYYDEETDQQGLAEFMIKKQRNGPTGVIELEFKKEEMRFEDLGHSVG